MTKRRANNKPTEEKQKLSKSPLIEEHIKYVTNKPTEENQKISKSTPIEEPIEYVTSDNIHSIFSMPLDIMYNIFERMEQADLLNCLEALPDHRDVIGLVIGRRLICVNVMEASDPYVMIRALRPFVRRLKLNFDFEPIADMNRQQVWIEALDSFTRLYHLELHNFVAFVYKSLNAGLTHLFIGHALIADSFLQSYVEPASGNLNDIKLRTLMLSNVHWLSGKFLTSLPQLHELQIKNMCKFFDTNQLVNYVARCGTLPKLHYETKWANYEFLNEHLIQHLHNVEDLSLLRFTVHQKMAHTVAQLPKLRNFDVEISIPALDDFFSALPDNSQLNSLQTNLIQIGVGSAIVLQRCHLRKLSLLTNLTTIRLIMPLPRPFNNDPPNTLVRCSLIKMIQQLAVLPALHTLSITSLDFRKLSVPTLINMLPHDLTGGLIATHLPRLQHLCVELPYWELSKLATMKELISLEVVVLRSYTKLPTIGKKRHRRRETIEVNSLMSDLGTVQTLQSLCVLANYVPVLRRTCTNFARGRVRVLELSVGLKLPSVVLLLKFVQSVRTYIDVRCMYKVSREKKLLQSECPHVQNWNLKANCECRICEKNS